MMPPGKCVEIHSPLDCQRPECTGPHEGDLTPETLELALQEFEKAAFGDLRPRITFHNGSTILFIDDPQADKPAIRTFDTGATRDTAAGKFEYAGYLSPLFINAFGRYMNKHQQLPDGSRRACDNWQNGMPLEVYVQSAWRHFFDFWAIARGFDVEDEKGNLVEMSEAIMGLVFNLQGYWHEIDALNDGPIKRGA